MFTRLLLLGFLALTAFSQSPPPPDCSIFFSFTASGSTSSFDNRSRGCVTWTLLYQSSGFSGLTLTFQSASGSLTAGSFGAYGGAVATGSNPNTSTTGAITTFTNGTVVTPWLRVTLTGLTGSGEMNGVLYGYRTGYSRSVAGSFLHATVVLHAADLEALNATPFEVVPAPGIAKFILPISFSASYTAGGTPYVDYGDGTALGVLYSSATGRSVALGNVLVSSAKLDSSDRQIISGATGVASSEGVKVIQNAPLVCTWINAGGRIITSVLGVAGLGYAPGDTFDIGASDGTGVVDTVGGGGAVLTYTVTAPGSGYGTGGQNTSATSGIGTGLVLNVTSIQTVAGGTGKLQIDTLYAEVNVL